MKKSAFALIAVITVVLAGPASAGYYDVPDETAYAMGYSSGKGGKVVNEMPVLPPEPKAAVFDPGVLTVDVLAGYTWADGANSAFGSSGFTTGLGGQVFYSEMFGFGGRALYWDSTANAWDLSASFIVRKPFHDLRLAPYLYGGGGGVFSSNSSGSEASGHVGVGLDWRCPMLLDGLGVMVDLRRNWFADSGGSWTLVAGLRISF